MSQQTSLRRALPRDTRTRFGGGVDVLLAASLWGTAGTVRAFAGGASAFSIAASRVVIGGMVLLAFAACTRRGAGLRRLLESRRNLALIGLGAAAIAVYQVAFFVSVGRTGVAVGTVVTIGSAPAFTGVIGVPARRSGLTGRWAASTAGAVTGCALLVAGGRDAGVEPVGVAMALLAGLSYGVYATVASVLITGGEEERAVVGALFGAAAVPLLPILSTGSGWLLTGSGALIALYLGVVTTGGGYLLFARGLRTTPATTATTLTLAEPAVAAALGALVLHERLGAVALCGLALLVASLVVLVAPAGRKTRR